MKRKYITKQTILKAIKTEPLKPGSFVLLEGDLVSDDPSCSVCAVGAVLRKAGMNNNRINRFGIKLVDYNSCSSSSVYRLPALLEEKRYLHALSVKYENLARVFRDLTFVRRELSKFVKKHFPSRIKLNARY